MCDKNLKTSSIIYNLPGRSKMNDFREIISWSFFDWDGVFFVCFENRLNFIKRERERAIVHCTCCTDIWRLIIHLTFCMLETLRLYTHIRHRIKDTCCYKSTWRLFCCSQICCIFYWIHERASESWVNNMSY